MNEKEHIRRRAIRAAVAAAMLASGAALAASSATQDVDITVQNVNEISVGTAVTLTINTAVAGGNPGGTATSSYSITTNSATSKKITAQLGGALAAGLTLSVNLQAPSTGNSSGVTALSTSASDVVTSIEAVAASALSISYAATATVAVAPNTYSADVTYTIVDDS